MATMADPLPPALAAFRVIADSFMIPGLMALEKGERLTWIGLLGSPIEDAVFDCIRLHPADYARLAALRAGREGDEHG